jgi:hypothetical protein
MYEKSYELVARGYFPTDEVGCGLKLTIHVHMDLRLTMHGYILPLPYTSPRCGTHFITGR